MKRYFIITIILMLLFAPICNAQEDIIDIIPREVMEKFQDIDATDPASILNLISFDKIIGWLQESVHTYLPQFCSMLAEILLLVLLFAIMDQFSFIRTKESYRLIISAFSSLVLSIVLFSFFSRSYELIEENLETILVFSTSCIPIITALLITGGKNYAAAFFSYSISISSTIINTLNQNIFMPLIEILFAVGCCAGLWQDVNFSAISSMIEKFIKWLITVVFSVFTFTLSVQSVLSKSADNVAQKILKGAAGSIPYMGKILSQGLDGAFVIASGSKTASAIIGVIVIVCVFIGPALLLTMQCIALYIARSAAELFGQKDCLSILKTVHRAYVLMLSLFLVSVLMCAI